MSGNIRFALAVIVALAVYYLIVKPLLAKTSLPVGTSAPVSAASVSPAQASK